MIDIEDWKMKIIWLRLENKDNVIEREEIEKEDDMIDDYFFLDRIVKLIENRNNVIERYYKMKIENEKWVELNVFILRFDGNIWMIVYWKRNMIWLRNDIIILEWLKNYEVLGWGL